MKAAANTWCGFWRLNATERGIVLQAAAALIATWAGLRLTTFRGWKYFLSIFIPQPSSGFSGKSPETLAWAQTISQRTSSAARHLFLTTSCLEQSLVLWWLLRRRGIPAELLIGGRKEAGRFEAHAWVEVAGAIIDNAAGEHLNFAPFERSAHSIKAQSH